VAKDPAFLFYSNDFLTGTFTMTDKQVGQYIRLMCLQHQQGHLSEEKMLSVCKKRDPDIWSKFRQDESGLYFNQRLEQEIEKRNAHCDKQKQKVMKRWNKDGINSGNTVVLPLENENEIYISSKSISNKSTGYEGTTDARADIARVMTFYEDQMGALPAPSAIEMLVAYTKDMGADVICRAIEITVNAQAKDWRYTEKILQNWTRAKVKSLADADRQEAQYNANKRQYQKPGRFDAVLNYKGGANDAGRNPESPAADGIVLDKLPCPVDE
jgi:DnaD/phage-associated family protein